MAINDKTIPYEILIRFDKNGAVAGAHLIKRRIVEMNGEKLKDELGDALPLALVQGQDGALLADVLGEACAQALAANGQMAAQVAALDAARGDLQERARQAEADAKDARESAATQVAQARAEAEEERGRAEATIAGLQAELDALRNPPLPTALAFLERFTAEERIALRTAAKDDPILDDILDLVRAAQVIDPADPRTREAFGYIADKGYLPAERIAQVLA